MVVEKVKLNGWSGWITAGLAVAAVMMSVGVLYRDVCLSAEANMRQDNAITALQIEQARVTLMAEDIKELKQDVKRLLQRAP